MKKTKPALTTGRARSPWNMLRPAHPRFILLAVLLLLLPLGGCTMFPTSGGINPGTDTAVSRETGAREGQSVNRATGNLY